MFLLARSQRRASWLRDENLAQNGRRTSAPKRTRGNLLVLGRELAGLAAETPRCSNRPMVRTARRLELPCGQRGSARDDRRGICAGLASLCSLFWMLTLEAGFWATQRGDFGPPRPDAGLAGAKQEERMGGGGGAAQRASLRVPPGSNRQLGAPLLDRRAPEIALAPWDRTQAPPRFSPRETPPGKRGAAYLRSNLPPHKAKNAGMRPRFSGPSNTLCRQHEGGDELPLPPRRHRHDHFQGGTGPKPLGTSPFSPAFQGRIQGCRAPVWNPPASDAELGQ